MLLLLCVGLSWGYHATWQGLPLPKGVTQEALDAGLSKGIEAFERYVEIDPEAPQTPGLRFKVASVNTDTDAGPGRSDVCALGGNGKNRFIGCNQLCAGAGAACTVVVSLIPAAGPIIAGFVCPALASQCKGECQASIRQTLTKKNGKSLIVCNENASEFDCIKGDHKKASVVDHVLPTWRCIKPFCSRSTKHKLRYEDGSEETLKLRFHYMDRDNKPAIKAGRLWYCTKAPIENPEGGPESSEDDNDDSEPASEGQRSSRLADYLHSRLARGFEYGRLP